MTRISVVIPHVPNLNLTDERLAVCTRSLRNCDELLVVVNSGTGYGANVNIGLAAASGDYLVVSNNDIEMISGDLRALNNHGKAFCVPSIIPTPRDNLPRAFFGFPRSVYSDIIDHYGYFFDERFKYYFEDDDLHKRIEELDIKIAFEPSIVIHHLDGGGLTCKQFGEEKGFQDSKKKFMEKWGQ